MLDPVDRQDLVRGHSPSVEEVKMKKVLKWIGVILSGLVGVILIAGIALLLYAGSMINKTYNIQPEHIAIPSNGAALTRGQHLEQAILSCFECHGEDFGGGTVIDEPGLMTVYAPNLTAGTGGVGTSYSDVDWIRAVRHGVSPDGEALFLMPADIFSNLSAEDLGAVIAYVRSFPPVDNQVPEPEISLTARIFLALGQLPESMFIPANQIDHDAPILQSLDPAVSIEYGEYLVAIGYCVHCHRADLSGGPFPFPDPEAPTVPNLALVRGWSENEFKDTIRTGVDPNGKTLDEEYMPWDGYHFTDAELEAIYLYLQSLPTAATGSQ
jgi:mono/diheme cytochrome c family protein